MIAYVFWHAAPAAMPGAEYERRLMRFGDALGGARIAGVIGAASYAIGETPWLGEPGYEDWTWLEGSWALDGLNERAISGDVREAHNAVAQATKHGGFGGLYSLVAGEHRILCDSKVLWLSRPRGIDWREAIAEIVQSASHEVAVWRRQMVLGPGSEFALIGPPQVTISVLPGWTCLEVKRRRVSFAASGDPGTLAETSKGVS